MATIAGLDWPSTSTVTSMFMAMPPSNGVAEASVGDYSWGGAASTAFYVDPVEDVVVTFFTQLLPSSTLPIRAYLRALVNQAIVA